MFAKGLKENCCRCYFWLFGGKFKKGMDVDLGEILRRLGGV